MLAVCDGITTSLLYHTNPEAMVLDNFTESPLQNLAVFALEMIGALGVGRIVILTALLISALHAPFIAFAL